MSNPSTPPSAPQKQDFLTHEGVQMLRGGYDIVPIRPGRKHPGMDDWPQLEATEEDLKRWSRSGFVGGGVGVKGACCPAVDVDVTDKTVVLEVLTQVEAAVLGDDDAPMLTRVGQAPKCLVPFRTDASFTKCSSKAWQDMAGDTQRLEILGDGQQWVAFGIHPVTRKPYRWRGGTRCTVASVPYAQLPVLTVNKAQALVRWFDRQAEEVWGWTKPADCETPNTLPGATGEGGTQNSEASTPPVEWEAVSDLDMGVTLNLIKPSLSHGEWLKVGMGCYAACKGDEWGFKLWNAWSARCPEKYNKGEMRKRWRSFASNRENPVSWGTVLHVAGVSATATVSAEPEAGDNVLTISDADRRRNQQKLNAKDMVKRVGECGAVGELIDAGGLCDELGALIRAKGLNAMSVPIVSDAIRERYHKLSGSRLPVAVLRDAITPKPGRGEDEQYEDDVKPWLDAPDWCKPWVMLHDGMVNVKSRERMSPGAFNVAQGFRIPDPSGTGNKQSAMKYVANGGYIQVVSGEAYLPWCDDRLTVLDGMSVLNTYWHEGVPAAKPWDETDTAAADDIAFVKQHFVQMLGEDEAKIMLSWMAWQVQRPGELLKWAPILCGEQGVGKSYVEVLMTAVMGADNVGAITSRDVTSTYTGWSTGRALNVIQELRVLGHNRYEAMEALKSVITDPAVVVRRMRENSFVTRNTCNYIGMTNHFDTLPIPRDDRRWWALRAQRPLAAMGEAGPAYYDRLFSIIGKRTGELRHWLAEHDIPAAFVQQKTAPYSELKGQMIATEVASHYGMDEAMVLLAEGGEGYCTAAFDALRLRMALNEALGEVNALTARECTTLFKKLGYMRHAKSVRVDGLVCKVWTKGLMSNAEVRACLQDGD